MAKIDVQQRFRRLIKKLNYNQIQLENINVNELVTFLRTYMPKVVAQLEPLGWDLSQDDTWLETAFITSLTTFYGKRVLVFITDSYSDYKLVERVFESPIMRKLWKQFNIDAHTAVLVDSSIFIEPEQLDDIYINLDFECKWSLLDLSGYDENDELLSPYLETWGFLENGMKLEDEIEPWSMLQTMQVRN
jgi:hypothetical protein